MGGIHHAYSGSKRADVGCSPPIDAHAVLHGPAANEPLGERADSSRDLLFNPFYLVESVGQRLGDLLLGLRLGLLALSLVGNGHGRSQLVGAYFGHR